MKYDLTLINGNSFYKIGYCVNAMEECGLSQNEIFSYFKKAVYNNFRNFLIESNKILDKCNEIYDKKVAKHLKM